MASRGNNQVPTSSTSGTSLVSSTARVTGINDTGAARPPLPRDSSQKCAGNDQYQTVTCLRVIDLPKAFCRFDAGSCEALTASALWVLQWTLDLRCDGFNSNLFLIHVKKYAYWIRSSTTKVLACYQGHAVTIAPDLFQSTFVNGHPSDQQLISVLHWLAPQLECHHRPISATNGSSAMPQIKSREAKVDHECKACQISFVLLEDLNYMRRVRLNHLKHIQSRNQVSLKWIPTKCSNEETRKPDLFVSSSFESLSNMFQLFFIQAKTFACGQGFSNMHLCSLLVQWWPSHNVGKPSLWSLCGRLHAHLWSTWNHSKNISQVESVFPKLKQEWKAFIFFWTTANQCCMMINLLLRMKTTNQLSFCLSG